MTQGIFSQYDSQDLNRIAAKGILEKLRNIRQRINVDFTARRLIWELIQNAKDNAATCNINGNSKVQIEIELSSNQLRFAHNNGYFTNENVRGLVRRYSSGEKDRESISLAPPPPTTGRFGTGFMTTHLLSETVYVRGVFQESDSSYCKFELPLDRTGQTPSVIIQSIEKSFFDIEESMKNSNRFNLSATHNFNTEFFYSLDEIGHKLADISIAEFDDCIAYTLINIPNIESVSVNRNGESYYYQTRKVKDFQAKTYKVDIIEIQSNNDATTQKHYATLFDENTRITIPIIYTDSKIEIQNPNINVPRLFLDFPMIGTEDLNIPFVINNPLFEPTESRDGVSLTGSSDKDTLVNSIIILKAFELYKEFIDFVCSEPNWGNLFNIARIKKPKEKEWLNAEWFKNKIIQPIQIKLLSSKLVDSNAEERISIKDSIGNNQIYFPSASKQDIRERLWILSNDLYPKNLPRKDHIHEWYDIIWNDCFEITLEELTKDIQRKNDIPTLSKDIQKKENETINWLNDYFDLLNDEDKFIDEIVLDKFKVIPNQNLKFQAKSDLFKDKDIEEELKNVLKILDVDIRDILKDNRVITRNIKIENDSKIKYGSKDQSLIIDQINKLLKENKTNSGKAVSHLLALFSSDKNFPQKRLKIYNFAKELLGDEIPEKKEIKFWDEAIWEYADRVRMGRLLKIVSDNKNLTQLLSFLKKNNIQETIEWLQSLINFVIECKYSEKLNITEHSILPNQNGQFKIKDDLLLDNGEIDENLKIIAEELGYHIKDELLDKKILFDLPENRVRTQEHVAEEISKLIKPILRDVTAREKNKDVIRKLYLWINKNRSIAEKIFSEIYEKRFLLISDDEITANIEKAEILDEIIGETGLSAIEIKDKLIELLTNPQIFEYLKKYKESLQSEGGLYPDGFEDDIMISYDLLNYSSEKSRISASDEAKEIIFETLRAKGFVVPNDIIINYTIVSGISKPNGTPIKVVVKSGKAGRIYFNPNEWIALTEADSQLFVLTRGNVVRNVTLSDIEANNEVFHMRFNTQAFALHTNLSAFANFFRYLPYTHFIFNTPERTTDFLEEFGLNRRNPSANTLSPDDKNLLR